MTVHTIYVPAGWSPEQVWEAIKRGDPIAVEPLRGGFWINVDEHGRLLAEEEPPPA